MCLSEVHLVVAAEVTLLGDLHLRQDPAALVLVTPDLGGGGREEEGLVEGGSRARVALIALLLPLLDARGGGGGFPGLP